MNDDDSKFTARKYGKEGHIRLVSKSRAIRVRREYFDANIRHRLWRMLHKDWFEDFKSSYPRAGREAYARKIEQTIGNFLSENFSSNEEQNQILFEDGSEFDAIENAVSDSTIRNFIGNANSTAPGKHISNLSLAYLHAYIQIAKPQLAEIFNPDTYFETLVDYTVSRYISESDTEIINKLHSACNAISGSFCLADIEEPSTYRNKIPSFIQDGYWPWLLMLRKHESKPVLIVHLVSTEQNIYENPTLTEDIEEDFPICLASGLAVPICHLHKKHSDYGFPYEFRFYLRFTNRYHPSPLEFHSNLFMCWQDEGQTEIANIQKLELRFSLPDDILYFGNHNRKVTADFVRANKFKALAEKFAGYFGNNI